MTGGIIVLFVIMFGYSIGKITTEVMFLLILLTCLRLLIHEISNSIKIKK